MSGIQLLDKTRENAINFVHHRKRTPCNAGL